MLTQSTLPKPYIINSNYYPVIPNKALYKVNPFNRASFGKWSVLFANNATSRRRRAKGRICNTNIARYSAKVISKGDHNFILKFRT